MTDRVCKHCKQPWVVVAMRRCTAATQHEFIAPANEAEHEPDE